jgi:DNA-binding MarR family transcriptional regulator
VPARAIGDQRLSGLHFRVLACIALHDRMSAAAKGRQGCWAGNKTLAEECGCNYTNLSTAITDLGHLGYVERERHPLNKNLRVYRVIYSDDDEAFTKSPDYLPTGKQSAILTVCPEANSDPQTVCPDTNQTGEAVCPDLKIGSRNQWLRPLEYIPRSGEDTPQKRVIDSAEAARIDMAPGTTASPRSPGGRLAVYERALKQGTALSAEALADLQQIMESEGGATSLYGWAERLLERVGEVQSP